MDDTQGSDRTGQDQQRILGQLDRMVSAGRVTPEEAERLRTAGDTDAFQAAVGEIMARHASAGMDAAVADGHLTQPEADDLTHRLRRGEHVPGLRKRLRQFGNLHRPSQGGQ